MALLNDWDAIFQVRPIPSSPSRTTRRNAPGGIGGDRAQAQLWPRTATGLRIFALLASVIDTCRKRGYSLRPYLQTTIADQRASGPLAPLPQ